MKYEKQNKKNLSPKKQTLKLEQYKDKNKWREKKSLKKPSFVVYSFWPNVHLGWAAFFVYKPKLDDNAGDFACLQLEAEQFLHLFNVKQYCKFKQ